MLGVPVTGRCNPEQCVPERSVLDFWSLGQCVLLMMHPLGDHSLVESFKGRIIQGCVDRRIGSPKGRIVKGTHPRYGTSKTFCSETDLLGQIFRELIGVQYWEGRGWERSGIIGLQEILPLFNHLILSGQLIIRERCLYYLGRGRILGRNPDKTLKSFQSFPPCYSQSPL